MALVDPYAPCHCGSGQKYKWCCQSVEAYVERSQRLLDNGQYELAIKPLLEGLAKVPDNVSLLLRKALVQLHLNQTESAAETLAPLAPETSRASGWFDLDDAAGSRHRRSFRQASPSFSRPCRLDPSESLAACIAGLVSRFDAWPARSTPRRRSSIWNSPAGFPAKKPSRVAVASAESASQPGCLGLGEESLSPLASARAGDRGVSRIVRAGRWAGPRKGSGHRPPRPSNCWQRALAPARLPTAIAGLCCLWLADHEGAVAALRRYITRTKPTTDSVDLEALCQKIEPPSRHDHRRFRSIELADPQPRRVARGACATDRTIAGNDGRPLDPHDPQRSRTIRSSKVSLSARSSAVEAEAGPSRAGHSDGRSRGARR